MEGGGEYCHPDFLPTFPRKGRDCSGQGRGRATRLTNRSQQVQASAGRLGSGGRPRAAPWTRLPSSPPEGPAQQGRPAPHSPPHPTSPRPGSRDGGGVGVPRRKILPQGWRRGRGWKSGNGGLRTTRARHERGRREGSWVKSGRAAPESAERSWGQRSGPWSPACRTPPRERSELEEPFCFRPRQRAPLLTELLLPSRWREEFHPGSPNPSPLPPPTQPNSTLPLHSLPSPLYRACNNAVNSL